MRDFQAMFSQQTGFIHSSAFQPTVIESVLSLLRWKNGICPCFKIFLKASVILLTLDLQDCKVTFQF